jgi:hypothetical protein
MFTEFQRLRPCGTLLSLAAWTAGNELPGYMPSSLRDWYSFTGIRKTLRYSDFGFLRNGKFRAHLVASFAVGARQIFLPANCSNQFGFWSKKVFVKR